MGKFVGFKTYEMFESLWGLGKINDHSLNFILDTGQIYTHGIYINGAVFGTAANGAVPLSIAGTTNTLALSNHSHSNYLEKNANVDIKNYKIISTVNNESNDLLYYSGGNLYIGNADSPVYISGTSLNTVQDNNIYSVLDTSNFSVTTTLPTGYTYNNTALIKYGSSSFLIDYIKRINTSLSFDYLNTYTQAGTNLLNGVLYGYMTLYTDHIFNGPSWALLRINIPNKVFEFRTSADQTNWITLNNQAIPAATDSVLGGIKVGTTLSDVTGYTKVHIKDNYIYYHDTTYSFSNLQFQQVSGTNLMTYNSQTVRTILAGSNITFTHVNNVLTIGATDTWTAFTAASANAAGTAGYIQAPAGAQEKFFRGDNTWQEIAQNVTSSIYFGASNGTGNELVATTPYLIFKEGTDYTRYKLEGDGGITVSSDASGNLKFTGTTYSVFSGASSSAAGSTGLVKLPVAGDQDKFLRGDCTWQTISQNVTSALYVGASNGTSTAAQSTNGNVYLIFAEGTSYTRFNIVGSGRASVTSDANGKITINSNGYNNFSAATSSAAGTAGLVPAPGTNILGSGGYFLRADGTWTVPTNTWKAANTTLEGYVPKAVAGKFLHSNDSTGVLEWVDDTNTWKAANTSLAGYVPKLTTDGGTITSADTAYVLVYKSGVNGATAPVWMQLPANAYNNTWTAGSSSAAGYVPAATKGKFLHSNASTGDLEWIDDNNTWKAASTAAAGYIPKLATGGGTISTQSSEYVLTYVSSGTGTVTPVWKLLPSNAFSNTWNQCTSSLAGYVPAATNNYFLHCNSSGTLEWVANPNRNTWRGIYVGGVSKVGTAINSLPINFVAGSNITVTYEAAGTDNGQSGNTEYFNIKIASTNSSYCLTLNGVLKGTNGGTSLGDFYAVATSNSTTANQVWMRNTNNDGYAWRTLGSNAFSSASYVPSSEYTLSSLTTSSIALSDSGWTETGLTNSTTGLETTGTYAVQITQDTGYYSGIMSWYAGTGGMDEEVALHYAGSTTPTRLYMKTGGGKIYLAADAAIAATTYTIKIRKLI